jgi:hypothetical protein
MNGLGPNKSLFSLLILVIELGNSCYIDETIELANCKIK